MNLRQIFIFLPFLLCVSCSSSQKDFAEKKETKDSKINGSSAHGLLPEMDFEIACENFRQTQQVNMNSLLPLLELAQSANCADAAKELRSIEFVDLSCPTGAKRCPIANDLDILFLVKATPSVKDLILDGNPLSTVNFATKLPQLETLSLRNLPVESLNLEAFYNGP